jgi:hypothetical protein
MTTGTTGTTGAPDDHDELFVADFYPELGEYLAQQHTTGYDAVAERTRFLLWLAQHVDQPAHRTTKPHSDG